MSLQNKTTLSDTSPFAPCLASFNGFLFMAYKGDSNDSLYVVCLSSDGSELSRAQLGETTTAAPSIVAYGTGLFVAWKGDGNDNINVAQLDLVGSEAGGTVTGYQVQGVVNKVTFPETSPLGPNLASDDGHLYITWKGDGNDNLNVAQVM